MAVNGSLQDGKKGGTGKRGETRPDEEDGGMVKGRKRRLDYTSPAAESLFGRNRFFITESFIDFIPNCTFARASVKFIKIARPFGATFAVTLPFAIG